MLPCPGRHGMCDAHDMALTRLGLLNELQADALQFAPQLLDGAVSIIAMMRDPGPSGDGRAAKTRLDSMATMGSG